MYIYIYIYTYIYILYIYIYIYIYIYMYVYNLTSQSWQSCLNSPILTWKWSLDHRTTSCKVITAYSCESNISHLLSQKKSFYHRKHDFRYPPQLSVKTVLYTKLFRIILISTLLVSNLQINISRTGYSTVVGCYTIPFD